MKAGPRILVVDDEPAIREICRLYLEQAGYQVEEASDGDAALDAVEHHPSDLVVLDIMLPGLDGLEVLDRIRARDQWLPVLLLSALTSEDSRIGGLMQGADDYLTKPFAPRELVARVGVILRRLAVGPIPDGQVIRVPGLVVDEVQRQVWRGGQPLTLTPREFDLLTFLIRHARQTQSRDRLLTAVWGLDFEGDDRTIDVHITRLRSKLERLADGYRYIHTVWGVGYRFEVETIP